MGLFDKITKSIETVGRNVSHEMQRREDTAYLKENILDRFDIRQLKNCCRYYKIGEPNPTEYNWSTGNANKVRLTKAHWIEHVQKKVSLDDIKDYAKKQRISISDVVKEENVLAAQREQIINPTATPAIDIIYPPGTPSKLLQDIIAEIEAFQPAKAYKEESLYQVELNGWLKSKFPSAAIEIQTGYSRPDIVVDDVAIEIKGPTKARDLDTILDKCHRYLQNHDHLIVVLFDVDVKADRYAEWLDSVKTHFPEVPVIRKDF